MKSKNNIKILRKKRRIKQTKVFGTLFILFSIIFTGIALNVETKTLTETENADTKKIYNLEILEATEEIKDSKFNSDEYTGEWRVEHIDIPTGTKFLVNDTFGGFWADAEKEPGADGRGNPPPVLPGDEDDLLCWAATASNMLEYTGWGFTGGMTHGDTDDFFDFFINHVNDSGSLPNLGLEWWFNGILQTWINWSAEDVDHIGFWPGYNTNTYISVEENNPDILPTIFNSLSAGNAVGIDIWPIPSGGGHSITCWGVNYNATLNQNTDWEDYYLGIWVTDSDSHKGPADFPNPPDVLRYFAVEYNSTGGYWYMPTYGGGYRIERVNTLALFPGNQRPTANFANTVGNEGSPITFDASGSSDPDGDLLEYRWDFDADGTWDTAWSASATASHTWDDDYTGIVYLEVFDGRLRDIHIARVTVNNVAPTITLNGDIIIEGDIATVTGTISDPSSLDTFVLYINWGDGTTEIINLAAGTSSFSRIHQYLDDNPSGTPSDVYSIIATVMDDDFGMDTEFNSVTVYNVAPMITVSGDVINENGIAIISGTIIDPGWLDTFTFIVNWGEGLPETYYHGNVNISSSFSFSHQYLDDNPTGTPSDDYTISITIIDDDTGEYITNTLITVNNVAPVANFEGVEQMQEFDLEDLVIVMLEPATFTASATDIGTDDLTFTWDWGDGTPITSTFYIYSGSPVDVTDIHDHIYSEPGEYIITLTVEDDDTGIDQYNINIKVLGPRDLKQMAISDLETLKTGDFCSDIKINHLIRKLECSLCDKLWEDEIRLNRWFGGLVFCYEMHVTIHMEKTIAFNNHMIPKLEKKIEWLENKGYNATCLKEKVSRMQEINSVYESAILKLVKADELLARVALNDAENTPVKHSKLQKIVDFKIYKANKYLLLALECIENGHYSKAISLFKHSWKFSQCAIKLAK